MKIKENRIFTLSHVCLYAKGWYVKTNDIFEDLKKFLQLDDYSPFDKSDVLSILIHRYEDIVDIDLLGFLSDIHKDNCWKIGYPNNLEYDYYTAIIYKILSDIRFLESKYVKWKCPKYSKQNPRPKNIELKTVIERFNHKTN